MVLVERFSAVSSRATARLLILKLLVSVYDDEAVVILVHETTVAFTYRRNSYLRIVYEPGCTVRLKRLDGLILVDVRLEVGHIIKVETLVCSLSVIKHSSTAL